MKRAPIGLALVVVLVAGGSTPASAQDALDASPSAEATQIPVTTRSGRPDLYLDMPYYIGGYEPEIVMLRGDEHFAGLDRDHPTRVRLEQLLETVGAETEDMVSGYALVSQEDFFAFVVGIRVDGVEPGSLLPAYLPILLADLEEPSIAREEIEGRSVTVVTALGDDDRDVEVYVYDEGDTVWLMQGPEGVPEATLAGLPAPLPAE